MSIFGLQQRAGSFLMGAEHGLGLISSNSATHSQLGLDPTTMRQTSAGASALRNIDSAFVKGHQGALNFANRINMNPISSNAARAGMYGRAGTLNFANKVNDHLRKQGRGVAGGFGSVGSLMSRMPMKHLATSYGVGTVLMTGVEVGIMGKPMNLQTVSEAAWTNIPFTLGMELAGGGFKGMAKHMGYQMLGEYAGLGPWGSLGLQVAGSTYLPGLGMSMAAGIAGYEAGKLGYKMHKEMYKLGKGVRKTEFETGDMSFATAEAATMRQRAVGAIQKSHMNMRSMLGREATILMGR